MEHHIVHLGDARDLSRFEDKTFGALYSSNTLEHFPRLETQNILREWIRVVETNGVVVLELPDIRGMLQDWYENKNSWEHFIERLYGTQDYEGNTHYTMFHIDFFQPYIKDLGVRIEEKISTHRMGGFRVQLRKHV